MQVGLSHIIGTLIAIFLMVGGAFAVGTRWTEPEAAASAERSAEEGETATTTEGAEEEFDGGAPSEALYDVVKVVDGDTIAIKIDGKSETIRLIGIDTPETNDSRVPVQCFGKEATAKLKTAIGNRVAIEKDPSQGERDKYDRLLAYIYTEEGTMLNKLLIAEGYAYEYTYDDAYKYQKAFKAVEADAKKNKRGLWAPNACPEPVAKPKAGAKTQPAAAAAAVSKAAPEPAPETKAQSEPVKEEPKVEEKKESEPEKKAEPEQQEEPEPEASSYTCSSNKYNCTHFKTQAEAQAVFDQCGGADNDVHKLDNNKDGEACESLP